MHPFALQINASPGGVPKRPVAEARFTQAGVAGDAQADKRHHGGPWQAVCLFAAERIADLAREGVPVFPGALGENVTTSGLDPRFVRVGDVYRLGREAEIQITKPRQPCTTIQVYSAAIIKRLWGPTVPWGESGFYARVVRDGTVRPLDPIALLAQAPEAPPPNTRKLSLPR